MKKLFTAQIFLVLQAKLQVYCTIYKKVGIQEQSSSNEETHIMEGLAGEPACSAWCASLQGLDCNLFKFNVTNDRCAREKGNLFLRVPSSEQDVHNLAVSADPGTVKTLPVTGSHL